MTLPDPAALQPGFVAVLRLGAVLLLACEALVLAARRGPRGAAPASRFVWAITPAAVFLGLCLWCSAAQPFAARVSPAMAAVP